MKTTPHDDHLEGWKAQQRELARQEILRKIQQDHKKRVIQCLEKLKHLIK